MAESTTPDQAKQFALAVENRYNMNKLYFITKLANNLNTVGMDINEAATLAAIYSMSDGAKSITTDKLKKVLGVRSLAPILKTLHSSVQRVSSVKSSPNYNRIRLTSVGEKSLALILNTNEKS